MSKNAKNKEELIKVAMAESSQKILDKFFIHQCMVRRFFKYNPEIFKKLNEFRSQLECIVEKDLVCSVSRAHVVYYVMNAMQNRRMLSFLKNGSITECRNFLFSMIEPIDSLFMVKIEDLLDDEVVYEIIDLMIFTWPTIDDILSKTNMFRYFTLYASTIVIDFQKLMVMQKLAEQEEIPLYAINTMFSPELTKWTGVSFNLLTKYPANVYERHGLGKIYLDIYCLFNCGGAVRKFNSNNVTIIDDSIANVVVDGEASNGRMYLSVPYTELPVDIDEAMRIFKNTVSNLLKDNGVYRRNTGDADYWYSNFYNKNDGASMPSTRNKNNIVLLKQSNSFLKLQSGLLVWDKVNIDEKSIEDSCEEVGRLIENNNVFTRSEITLANDYEYVASLINPESKSGGDLLSKVLSKKNNIVVK
ncbi:TPA: hypothetical protein ACNP37_004969 [Raoultella ornithinolytica]